MDKPQNFREWARYRLRYGQFKYIWLLAIASMLYIWWSAPFQIDKIILVCGKICIGALLGMLVFMAIERYIWKLDTPKDQTWIYCCVVLIVSGMYCVSQAV